MEDAEACEVGGINCSVGGWRAGGRLRVKGSDDIQSGKRVGPRESNGLHFSSTTEISTFRAGERGTGTNRSQAWTMAGKDGFSRRGVWIKWATTSIFLKKHRGDGSRRRWALGRSNVRKKSEEGGTPYLLLEVFDSQHWGGGD